MGRIWWVHCHNVKYVLLICRPVRIKRICISQMCIIRAYSMKHHVHPCQIVGRLGHLLTVVLDVLWMLAVLSQMK